MTHEALEKALTLRVAYYVGALNQLEDLASPETENDVHDRTLLLREAVELVRCLRRLTRGRSVQELHAAFGAPGDFGYETPIGAALSRLYRGES